VKAAGVNPVDTYIRSGSYHRVPSLPYCPGNDGAGIVEAIGKEVTKFKVCRKPLLIVLHRSFTKLVLALERRCRGKRSSIASVASA